MSVNHTELYTLGITVLNGQLKEFLKVFFINCDCLPHALTL